ncbi:MAG: hypothetical protein IIY06_05615, partial [Proteobacteria bacterium]|nr:hypothetical protein [Pseudomonadota bacterium]
IHAHTLTTMETAHADTLTTMATTHADTLTTMATTRGYAYDDGRSMERPYKAVGITRHWASHGIGHHTALGITRHVDTGGTDIHADTLTTMETTRGYAYDDGRSAEQTCTACATQLYCMDLTRTACGYPTGTFHGTRSKPYIYVPTTGAQAYRAFGTIAEAKARMAIAIGRHT